MGGRAKRAVASALEHEGWEVHPGMEPGIIDIEAHRGPELWLVCVVNMLDGQTEQQALPPSRRVKQLVSAAKERGATPVVGMSTGEGVLFKVATDMSDIRG